MTDEASQAMQVIEAEWRQARAVFEKAEFYDARRDWDRLIEREFPTKLQPELALYQEGIDYETPDGEQTKFDHCDVLMMNPTEVRVTATDKNQTDTGKRKARTLMLMLARAWAEMNQDRWWDASVGEGQVSHGLKVMRLNWHPREDLNEGAEYAPWPFYWEDVDIYGTAWLEKENEPNVFYYEFERPSIDSRKYENGRPYNDSDGKLAWLGDGEALDQTLWEGKVKYLIRDAPHPKAEACPVKDCNHARRIITLCCYGQNESAKEGYKLEEIDSPFPGSAFMIIPARRSFNRNPHKRFRPLMYPLLVEMWWHNYLVTLLATLARKDASEDNGYLTLPDKDVLQPEDGIASTYEKPAPGSNELPVLPSEVRKFPSGISQHLVTLIQQSRERMARYMANRFLTGTAFEEASDAGVGTYIQASQQAALPYNRLLAQSDAAIRKALNYMIHAIKYWDAVTPSDSQQAYGLTWAASDHVVVGYGSPKDGERLEMTAADLDFPFDIKVKTASETVAEQAQNWSLGKDKYQSGVYGVEDLMRAAGVRDVEGQKRAMYKERLRKRYAPIQEQRQILVLERMQMTLLGFQDQSIAELMLRQAQGQQNGNTPPNPASTTALQGRPPVVQVPALAGGVSGGGGPM